MSDPKVWTVDREPLLGWKVVNIVNPNEAVRDPENGFAVHYFPTAHAARAMADVLNAAGG